MRRELWLMVALLGCVGMPMIAAAQTCTLPKAAQAPEQEVLISCIGVQANSKATVALKGETGNQISPQQGVVQDGGVKFPAPTVAGVYSVTLTIDSKPVDVQGQLKLATPTTCVLGKLPGKLPSVAPGQEVEITGCMFSGDQNSNDQKDVSVFLTGTDGKEKPAKNGVEKNNTLTFSVPSNTPTGQYSLATDSKVIKGQLDVMGLVEVDAIYPGTTYPLQKGFDFKISGKNFSTDPKGNKIEVVDEGLLGFCKPNPPNAQNTPCVSPYQSPSNETLPDIQPNSTTEISVTGFYPKHHYGPVKIIVHVGDGKSAPASVTFAPVSQNGVALAAAFVFFVVAYILYRLVTKGLTQDVIDGVKATPWTALFLDRETNSYSLSKFQVIFWTAVTVYGYVYIFLCRTLIQGDFRFPDISQNLPQLFFVSAGTTVAAAAITATVGSKGAGPVQPSASDFISTGGMVAGDRFQFFTWTIVGCIGYLYLVIRMNPETPNISLPEIPQNFLYLMGVSSAGYLGGKIVRKPGPVIKTLSVAKVTPHPPPDSAAPPAPNPATSDDPSDARTCLGDNKPKDDKIRVVLPVLTLNLKGENLDPTGKVKIGDQTLSRGDMFWIDGQPDAQSGFCSEMNVSLNNADQYIDGAHPLTLVNTDGQSATVTFPVDAMIIDPIPPQARVTGDVPGDVPVKVTGKNFVDGTTFEWRNPATKVAADQSGNATFKSATELTVTLKLGATTGLGKLTLISPIKLKASASVTVT